MPVESLLKKIFCVAAIASPESFFSLVEKYGAQVVEKKVFPDHHYFTRVEIDSLLDQAKKQDALLLTTEKDIVKIRKVLMSEEIYFLEIAVEFVQGEEEIKSRVKSALETRNVR